MPKKMLFEDRGMEELSEDNTSKNIVDEKNRIPKILIIVLVLVLVVSGYGAAYYYHYQYQQLKKNPNIANQDVTAATLKAVGKLIELPAGETPTIATVLDKDKLKDQPFFQNAENGDELLAFSKAMKAILYRPSTNMIIEVAPLTINNTASSTATKKLTVAIYNGTNTVGLTSNIEKQISSNGNIDVVSKSDAARKDYQGNLVVDITGTNASAATVIAKNIGGTVSNLPSGESKPNADILIIAGKK